MTCAKHLIRIMCLLFVKISWDGGSFDHSYFTENKAESRVIWPGLQTLIIDWHSIHLVHRTPSLKSFYHDKTPSLHKYMKYCLYIQSISLIRAGDACRWGLGWFFLSTQKNPWHRRVNCWKRMSWPLQILTDEEKITEHVNRSVSSAFRHSLYCGLCWSDLCCDWQPGSLAFSPVNGISI